MVNSRKAEVMLVMTDKVDAQDKVDAAKTAWKGKQMIGAVL